MKRIKSEIEKNLEYCINTVSWIFERTGITYKSVSLYLGRGDNYVSHALNEAFRLNMETFFKILEFFGIAPAEFFSAEFRKRLDNDLPKVKELKSNAEKNLSRLGIKVRN